jgi:hypothetical protein
LSYSCFGWYCYIPRWYYPYILKLPLVTIWRKYKYHPLFPQKKEIKVLPLPPYPPARRGAIPPYPPARRGAILSFLIVCARVVFVFICFFKRKINSTKIEKKLIFGFRASGKKTQYFRTKNTNFFQINFFQKIYSEIRRG